MTRTCALLCFVAAAALMFTSLSLSGSHRRGIAETGGVSKEASAEPVHVVSTASKP